MPKLAKVILSTILLIGAHVLPVEAGRRKPSNDEAKKGKCRKGRKKSRQSPLLRLGSVQTLYGLIGYRSTGSLESKKTPIICLHMAPRSSDEYKEISPILSGHDDRPVIALDLPGFGNSEPQVRDLSFDDIGDLVIFIADHFGICTFAVVGNLSGVYYSINVAARYPARVSSVVLSNPYRFLDALVELAKRGANFDFDFQPNFTFEQDGSHYQDLWDIRKNLVDPKFNTRLVADHMQYQVNGLISLDDGVEKLLPALNPLFPWESASKVRAPVLLLFGEVALQIFDLLGLDATGQKPGTINFFNDVESKVITDGSLWQMNQLPEKMAEEIIAHVDKEYV